MGYSAGVTRSPKPQAHVSTASHWFCVAILASVVCSCGARDRGPVYPAHPGVQPQAPTQLQPGYPQPTQIPAEAPAGGMQSAPTVESTSPTDLNQAIGVFEQARAELEGAFSPAPPASAAPSGLSYGAPSADCGRACRALGSMARAAQAICDLTSPSDERCRSARDTVLRNQQRTAGCGC